MTETKRVIWEDILPKYPYKGIEVDEFNTAMDTAITLLKQAEKEGKICINPPESVFIEHIKSHLKEDEAVICKICGKSVGEIYYEYLWNR
jgi:hypothetical protein